MTKEVIFLSPALLSILSNGMSKIFGDLSEEAFCICSKVENLRHIIKFYFLKQLSSLNLSHINSFVLYFIILLKLVEAPTRILPDGTVD